MPLRTVLLCLILGGIGLPSAALAAEEAKPWTKLEYQCDTRGFNTLNVEGASPLPAGFEFWGFIDVTLSINMLKRRLWAFPVSIWLIALFVLYELYRFSHTHSFVLALVITADMTIMWLIRKEYLTLVASRNVAMSRIPEQSEKNMVG